METLFYKIYRYLVPQKSSEEIIKKYNIPSKIRLNVAFNKEGWIVLTSPDLPGLITQGRNFQEIFKMANDAVLTYFDVPKREADYIFDVNIEGHGCISDKKKFQGV